MATYVIGPTFGAECAAAGIDAEGWSVDIYTGAFFFRDDVPQAARDALAAVFAVHDPNQQTVPPTVPYPVVPPGVEPPVPGPPPGKPVVS